MKTPQEAALGVSGVGIGHCQGKETCLPVPLSIRAM